jgi:hypothetical protein
MTGDLPIQKQSKMTENQLIELGFKRVYIDENSDIIDEKLVNENFIYYWYILEIENTMRFESIAKEEVINDNWIVDFGFSEDWELNGFKIESYETVKSIIDLFKTLKLK